MTQEHEDLRKPGTTEGPRDPEYKDESATPPCSGPEGPEAAGSHVPLQLGPGLETSASLKVDGAKTGSGNAAEN